MSSIIRWLFIFLIVGLLVGTVGGVILLSRFDPNEYRGLLESKLAENLKLQIRLGRLSFAWRSGPTIAMDGLQVQKQGDERMLLVSDSAAVYLDPFSLLQFKLVLGINIPDARLSYRDERRRPPREFQLEGVDLGFGLDGSGKSSIEIHFQDGAFTFKGEVFPSKESPHFQAQLDAKQFDLEAFRDVFEALGEGGISLAGRANANLKFEGSGKDWSEISKSLVGKGTVDIRSGALKNVNAVKMLLSRVTVIPGIEAALLGATPPQFQDILMGNHTPFDSLQGEVNIENGRGSVEKLFLADQRFQVHLKGRFSLDGQMDFRGQIVLLDEMSRFLISRVGELSYLGNPQGQLVLPFTLRGLLRSPNFRPDLPDLAQRVVVTRGTELLEKGLEALSKIAGEKR